MTDSGVVQRFQNARRSAGAALLEGFHPVKHALRFGAEVLEIATSLPDRPDALAARLAPDVREALAAVPLHVLPEGVVRSLCSGARGEPIVALARRRGVDVAARLRARGGGPVVLLEAPTNLANVGAVVRVAAAAGAAAVLVTGVHDPWHPAALRGSAGLHFALPVARVAKLDLHGRPLVAVHPAGATLPLAAWPPDAVLAFGSERRGLSDELLQRADARIAIPMRAGVSSLSLATAVAVALYAPGRTADLTRPWPAPRAEP